MKDEKPMDYIAFCLCMGLAEYDANQIVPEAEDRDNKQAGDTVIVERVDTFTIIKPVPYKITDTVYI